MSVPVPRTEETHDEDEPHRRVSEGDRLDVNRLRGGQLNASPMAAESPLASESTDKDINQQMRNMTVTEDTTPALSPNPYEYNSYPNSGQHHPYTPSNQSGYQPYPRYQSQPGYQHPINYQTQPQSQIGYQSQPGYQSQQSFQSQSGPYPPRPDYYEPSQSDFSLATMHGMPGYQNQNPVPRNVQSVSPLYSGPSNASLTPRPYGWGTPPMSPSMATVPYGNRPHQGGYDHSGNYGRGPQEDYGPNSPMVYNDGSGWMAQAPQYNYYQPNYQPQHNTRDQHHNPRPPMAPQGFQQHRASYAEQKPPANRSAWTGQAVGNQKDRERKAYHPQPPARRSDWVMWVGNIPGNTSHEELWKYFNSTVPTLPDEEEAPEWHGPSSIFLISRSQCAFVNLSSELDLDRAVRFFNGRSLRPNDQRCPRMVCRIRKKDDDLRAGVGAQRGTGMHREWIKGRDDQNPPALDTTKLTPNHSGMSSAKIVEPPSPAVLEQPPEGEGRRRESIAAIAEAVAARDASITSMASTNSSFLVRHFPKRFFILKSLTTVELEDSVRSGTWKTQRHNEPVLDQAFRTAQEVILVFSANKSGEFFGYAKMVEPIDKVKAAARAAKPATDSGSRSSGSLSAGDSSSGPAPPSKPFFQEDVHTIAEEDESEAPKRPQWLTSQSSSRFAASSPGQLTPHSEEDDSLSMLRRAERERKTESPRPVGMGSLDVNKSTLSAPAATGYGHSSVPNPEPSFFDIPVPHSGEDEAKKQEALGGSSRPQDQDKDGVLRKDTVLTPSEKAVRQAQAPAEVQEEFSPEDWGTSFRIEWIRVGTLPFHRLRSLRNPWNADREVKVSRDGTEIEPATAATLLTEWDRMGHGPNIPSFPDYR